MSETAEQTTDRAIALLEGNMPYLKGDPSEWVYTLAISALRAQSEAIEPEVDQWAYCPTCGYGGIFGVMINCAHKDNWMPQFCPNCGQAFKYGDDWKDENGRYYPEDATKKNKEPAQSEAERKIEKAIAECKEQIKDSEDFFNGAEPDNDFPEGRWKACSRVLEILEGAE